MNEDIETLLENIRQNCVVMNKEHKKRYLYLKNILIRFRLPIICLSGVNSVVAVGLQPYLSQNIISATTCVISLVCGIIGSIELYLQIQAQTETELLSQKEYYLLGINIFKTLQLNNENRNVDLRAYLDETFSTYQKLIENSCVIRKKIQDHLSPINMISSNNSLPSDSSSGEIDQFLSAV